MNKLRRYSAVTKTGIVTVCLDADVSALEAENEMLREAITKYIKQLHCESEVCSELHLPEAATTAHVHAKDLEAILSREQEKQP